MKTLIFLALLGAGLFYTLAYFAESVQQVKVPVYTTEEQ